VTSWAAADPATSWAAADPATSWAAADPADSGIVDALFEDLASPNSALRDDTVYPIFTKWVRDGSLDESLISIGDRLAAMLSHPEIQARTFATLILGTAVRRAAALGLPATAIDRWRFAFGSWWLAETDLRGYDSKLGWLHAIAHGADTVRAFALAATTSAQLESLLSLVRDRLFAPTDYLFADAEDERVAYALAVILSRPELDDHVSWLEPIRAAFEAGEPGPVPAWVSNTQRTLNSLFVAISRGVVVYDGTGGASERQIASERPVILDGLADVIRLPSYWLG
jgi:hypothetical protein